jgi:hypothetical protein
MTTLSLLVFSQKVLLEAAKPNAIGSGLEAKPKSLPKGVVSGLTAGPNAIRSGSQ